MVNANKAGFDLRETHSLSHNILHSQEIGALADLGQRTDLEDI